MSTFTILGKSFTLWCFDQKSKVIFKVIIVDIEYNKIKNITLDGLLIDKLENEIDTIGRVFDEKENKSINKEELAMLEFWKGLSKAKIIFPYSQNMLLDNSLFEVKNESDLEFNLRPTVKDGLMDNKYVYLKDVVNMQIDDLLEQFNCDGFLCLSNKNKTIDEWNKNTVTKYRKTTSYKFKEFYILEDTRRNYYNVPTAQNFESIDSFIYDENTLFLYQVTVSMKHSIKLSKKISTYWDKDIYLYFVVPPEIFYRFPPQKYKNSKNDDHQKFPTWINKLSQYALE
ncbi:19459_t:CDS:2, partial [Funneliformis geosporum]